MAADQVQVAVVAGATGLVGQAVLADLLTAKTSGSVLGTVHVVYAKERRAPTLIHPLLNLHAVDFTAMPVLPRVDDVYIALGTTIAVAGSQAAFRAVDYDAALAVARAARSAGATRCGVVSAMGAHPDSRIFYNRIKGELERDIERLGFTTLVIARPSLLAGDRQSLQQPRRRAELLSVTLFNWLAPIIPVNYRARPAIEIAHALVHAVQSRPAGLHVLRGRSLSAPATAI